MTKSRLTLFLIIAGAAVIYFFFLAQWEKLSAARSDASAAAKAIAQLNTLSVKRKELEDTYNTVKASQLEKADTMITTGPQVAVLLTDLEAIAAQNGLIMRSVNFSERGVSDKPANGKPSVQLNLKQGVAVLPVTMQVVGTYGSFRRFLADVELNSRILDVVSINFTSSGKEQVYGFDVQLRAYYQ